MSHETILSASTHPVSPHYLSQLSDGKYRAGMTAEKAKTYISSEEVVADFIEAANNGDHSAWSICYALQD